MNKTLRHEEDDRVPISDEFWDGFLKSWQDELGLPDDTNPYIYYDLNWICIVPKMDPLIKSFEVFKETEEDIIGRTGYDATV